MTHGRAFRFAQSSWTHALFAVLTLCVTAGATLADLARLQRDVSTVISNAKLGNAAVAVSIVDVTSGRELVLHQPDGEGDRSFIPASNMKLLTSGAAVTVLGPDFEFQTRFHVQGDRVIILGSGDPALADPELLETMQISVEEFVSRIAKSICEAATTSIREIIVDDRIFDREYVHPDWRPEHHIRGYGAQVSGLNFHANVIRVFAVPGATPQDKPAIRAEPSGSWLELVNLTRTTQGGSTNIWAERDTGTNTMRIRGTVPVTLRRPITATIHEPSLVFADLLAVALHAQCRGVDGRLPARRLAADQETFGNVGAPVVVVRTPLSLVLQRCNADSANLYAEALLKLIGNAVTGHPGSWSNGATVLRMQLRERIGAQAASEAVIADGSGLARTNLVTAPMLTRWLTSLGRDPGAGEIFYASLPLAGQEGTLQRRFRNVSLNNEVRAKSGFISGVRTLSGYITDTSNGRRLAFAVLVNNVPSGRDAEALKLHEEIVACADAYLARTNPATAGANMGSD